MSFRFVAAASLGVAMGASLASAACAAELGLRPQRQTERYVAPGPCCSARGGQELSFYPTFYGPTYREPRHAGCFVSRPVLTPYGQRWQRVWVCG